MLGDSDAKMLAANSNGSDLYHRQIVTLEMQLNESMNELVHLRYVLLLSVYQCIDS